MTPIWFRTARRRWRILPESGGNLPLGREGSTQRELRTAIPGTALRTPAASGTLLAVPGRVRVLQARFHFFPDYSHEPLIVAHLVWDTDAADACPAIQPTDALMRQEWPKTILSKLQHLVATTAPDSFRRLQALNSRFWSFVDVSSVVPGPPAPRWFH